MFSDTFGITSKGLLLRYPTPEDMLAVSAKKFASLIAEASRGRFGEEKAKQLKAVAEGSFGVSFAKDAFSLQIRQLLEQITLLENQIKELEEQVFSLTWLSRFLFFDQ